jgi:hypothetical protein
VSKKRRILTFSGVAWGKENVCLQCGKNHLGPGCPVEKGTDFEGLLAALVKAIRKDQSKGYANLLLSGVDLQRAEQALKNVVVRKQ